MKKKEKAEIIIDDLKEREGLLWEDYEEACGSLCKEKDILQLVYRDRLRSQQQQQFMEIGQADHVKFKEPKESHQDHLERQDNKFLTTNFLNRPPKSTIRWRWPWT